MRATNIGSPDFEYDPTDIEGFRAGLARVGKELGGADSGVSVYELAPGQAICPYHYEVGEEEWLLVLSGTPTLRDPDGERRLEPWDLILFPKGPTGAHGIRNDCDEQSRVLMFSTLVAPTVTVYPDSDKIGIYSGEPDSTVVVRRSADVPYYEGEGSS